MCKYINVFLIIYIYYYVFIVLYINAVCFFVDGL